MSDRVRHVEGDLAGADLGGPYDGALCFNIIHHLTPEQIVALFSRIHDALKPGGTFAVLDLFTPPRGRQPDAGSPPGPVLLPHVRRRDLQPRRAVRLARPGRLRAPAQGAASAASRSQTLYEARSAHDEPSELPSFAPKQMTALARGRWLTDSDQARRHSARLQHGQQAAAVRSRRRSASTRGTPRFLAEHGFNTVRLGLIWKAVEPEPGRLRRRVPRPDRARRSTLLGARGRPRPARLPPGHAATSASTARASRTGRCRTTASGRGPTSAFPGNYVVMRALWRAYDHFWANDPGPGGVGLQDRYAAAWRHVAERFRDDAGRVRLRHLQRALPGLRGGPLRCGPAGTVAFDRR